MALLCITPCKGWADDGPHGLSVLVISSAYQELPFSRQVEAGIEQVLHFRSGQNTVYFEYLDSARLDPARFNRIYAQLMAQKYATREIDVVVVWAGAAARFLNENVNVIQPRRVVAVDARGEDLDRVAAEGIPLHFLSAVEDYVTPVKTAVTVGQARRLVLVGESTGGAGDRRHQGILQGWRYRPEEVTLVDLFDQSLDAVLRQVAVLPTDTVVYYALVFHDGQGRNLRPVDALRQITAVSTAPVFTQWDSLLPGGPVGGLMASGEARGTDAARLATAMVGGDGAAVAGAVAGSPYRLIFDGSQLARWKIDLGRLPAGSTIVNQPPSLWADFHDYVVSALLAGMALALIAVALLWGLVRRQRQMVRLAEERQRLTDEVQAGAADLEKKASELARSNRELESFAYAISHDLRTPLRAVHSYAQLLRQSAQSKFDDEEKAFMGFIRDGADRLDAMVRGLLDYSRVGRADRHHFEPLDLESEVVASVGSLNLSVLWPEALVAVDFPPALPKILADGGAVSRLVQNLIENAVKYRAPDRPLTIGVAGRVSDDQVVLSVADNGIGIDPSQQTRIFGLFQRLAPASNTDGYGVGLALCQRIMDVHGGRIWVESVPGQGSTFFAAFPAMAPGGAGIDPGKSAPGKSAPGKSAPGKSDAGR